MEGRVLLSVSNPAGPVVMTTDFAASLTPSPSPSASLTPTPTGTLLTLSDTGDAHVRDGSYAGQNFGQVTPMEVKNVGAPGYSRETYLQFDLTGVASADQITSAKVRLFGSLLSTAAPTLPVGLFPVASTWTESGLTWNTRPAAGSTAAATGTVSGTTGAWYEFNVTNYLKQQKLAGATSVAFAVKGTAAGEGFAGFNSDEASTNKPQLAVLQEHPPRRRRAPRRPPAPRRVPALRRRPRQARRLLRRPARPRARLRR